MQCWRSWKDRFIFCLTSRADHSWKNSGHLELYIFHSCSLSWQDLKELYSWVQRQHAGQRNSMQKSTDADTSVSFGEAFRIAFSPPHQNPSLAALIIWIMCKSDQNAFLWRGVCTTKRHCFSEIQTYKMAFLQERESLVWVSLGSWTKADICQFRI